eukprot:TRINITY_DN11089_c0_g1_i2.p1 TRINITY_DN11089_c0_g1~~TRINITY_DN11089_c0_g1_i2.p1  ORF type:complete len:143 (-),score=29.21 TRINITY_DN11089_c0_g1_i2:64-492(-)
MTCFREVLRRQSTENLVHVLSREAEALQHLAAAIDEQESFEEKAAQASTGYAQPLEAVPPLGMVSGSEAFAHLRGSGEHLPMQSLELDKPVEVTQEDPLPSSRRRRRSLMEANPGLLEVDASPSSAGLSKEEQRMQSLLALR